MLVLEISKKYCKTFYNNSVKEVIKQKDGVIFDDYTIKKGFNNGNGTVKDLKRYIKDNKQYCYYFDLEKAVFL